MRKQHQQSDGELRRFMRTVTNSCVDPLTDEANATSIAEAAADEFGCEYRLDDDTDSIWTVAAEIAIAYDNGSLR